MKRFWYPIFLAAIFLFFATCKHEVENKSGGKFIAHPTQVAHHEVQTLPIDSDAPDFSLPDIHGEFKTLADFHNSRILVVVFTCNHCPTAQAYEDRLIQFTSDYRDQSVSVVAIMPNSTLTVLPEECGYTDLNDSFDEMKIRAADKHYNFPYLYDGDNQEVSIKYGPAATPHAFVFDGLRKLRYTGRIDGSEKPGSANAQDLRAAVDAVLAGGNPFPSVNKTFGCSVKWGWQGEWGRQVEKEWNDRTVTLEKIKEADIRKLIQNDSKKLRLVNVWATWCAPCVAEYPSLVVLQRMYGNRNFEFVSLSADNPGNADETIEFLKTKHSAVRNLLYDGMDNYKLIDAVNPAWNGALPYTVLIEPGGRIVYRSDGPVNLLELKRKVVDHPLIGRYY